jgi:hypothetical protein
MDHHFMTNQLGMVEYEHDPALEVILNVHVTYLHTSGMKECYGIVRIKPDKTVDETFVLPFNF